MNFIELFNPKGRPLKGANPFRILTKSRISEQIQQKKKKEDFSKIDFIAPKIDKAKKGNLPIFSTGERHPKSLQARFLFIY